MNNYIDERVLPYRRPQTPKNRYVRVKKGRPLARNTRKVGIAISSLRFVAAIFLLLLSTLGGGESGKSDINAEKVVKNCIIYAGITLALWGILVLMSNLANAVMLLPTWSLILIFAATILIAAGVLKNKEE